ncbi:MAG: hypothetical protein Q7T82_13640 [Armatimonadota bacterium]|nr:hypothetical protein [Armatimonadota bacterium]
MAAFFDEVRGGSLKVRIMFTQNAHVPQGLSKADLELQYYKLYYQFIKHAFGLAHTERNNRRCEPAPLFR